MYKMPNLAFPLKHEETATSYASRLAAFIGVNTPFDLCNDLGLDWRDVVRGDRTQLRALAALGGASEADMLRWSVTAAKGLLFRIGNDIVPNKTLLRSRTRVCPKCIVEDRDTPYRRFHWNLISLRTCERHSVPLIQLPHLEHTFGNYDFVKRVGAHEDLIERAAEEGQTREFTPFERYLLDRLRSKVGSVPFADRLTLPTFTRLNESLGLRLMGSEDLLSVASEASLHRGAAVAFEYISRGEGGLLEAMKKLHVDPLQSNASHKIDYGQFWAWLRAAKSAPDIEVIRKIARTYVFENYPIQKGTVVLGEECPKTQIYSLHSAKREHGISRMRLVRSLIDFGVARSSGGRPEAAVLERQIRAEDIERIIKHRDGYLSRREAVALLSSSDRIFRQLRLNGTIHQHIDDIDKRPVFDPKEINAFLEPILAAVPYGKCSSSDLPLTLACRDLGTDIFGATQLVKRGLVRSARRVAEGKGLDQIMVDTDDLRDVLIAQMLPAQSQTAATRVLRTSLRTIAYLIDQKELAFVKRGPPLKGYDFPAIPDESIEMFLKNYTTVGRIAQGSGCNFMIVMHFLEQKGVEPVPVPKGVGRYYRRDSLRERRRYLSGLSEKTVDWDSV